jgi:hypothetical protein
MSRNLFAAFSCAVLATIPLSVLAQDAPVVRIENGWQTHQALNIEKGVIESTPAGPGWLSAQWELLPSKTALHLAKDGLRRRTLRNVWTKQYLTFLGASGQSYFAMAPDDGNADWYIDPVPGYPGYFRIQSVTFESGHYLHVERGKLEVGPIQPNWQSAWWKIPGYVPVDYTAPVAEERARSAARAREELAAASAKMLADEAAAQRRANNDQAQARYQAQQQAQDEADSITAAQSQGSSGRGLGVILGSGKLSQSARVAPQPGTPANTYRAAIDFCHSNLANTGTTELITVEFLGLDGLAGTQTLQGSGNCSALGAPASSDLQVEFKTYFDVRAVRISIGGFDAFFIDQVQLFKDGSRIVWDGRTNGGGWCLSKDPNNYRDWAAATNICATTYTFNTASN